MNRKHPPIACHLFSRWLLACAAWLLGSVAAPVLATTISAGYEHTCSVSDAGLPTCWGSVPVDPAMATVRILDTKAGNGFSCALSAERTVHCWGPKNEYSQRGLNFDGRNAVWPMALRQGAEQSRLYATQIAAGMRHACALTQGGEVACWGDAGQGQMGLQEPVVTTTEYALRVPGLSNAVRIAAGNGSTCAVLRTGAVWCVGAGSLLAGPQDDPRTPRQLPGIDDAVDVSLFDGHACVQRSAGKVACWGRNLFGQLGVPAHAGTVTTPVDVPGLGTGAKAVAVGYGFSCALLQDGRVQCWGDHSKGQLGIGYVPNQTGAVYVQVVGITDAVAISAGLEHACAVLDGGYAQCWGKGTALGNNLCYSYGAYYPNTGYLPYKNPDFTLAICAPPQSHTPFAVSALRPYNDATLVMDWAERSLPQTFPVGQRVMADHNANFRYRLYPGGHALGVNDHGTPHLMYMGPDTNGQLRDLGRLAPWAREARK